MHRLITDFWKKIKIYFRYSFPVRVTESKKGLIADAFFESRIAKSLNHTYKYWERKLINYSGSSSPSLTIDLMKEAKREVFFLPVKTGSLIVVAAVLTNTILSFIFKKSINLYGWIIRLAFLSVGLGGLFCSVAWSDLKKTSSVIKKFNEKK